MNINYYYNYKQTERNGYYDERTNYNRRGDIYS